MSTFPKYFYNGIDLILIPGKNYSKNNLINRLKKMNIKVNNNKYSKGDLIKIYDNSLKEEKNIEKILDILISDTNNELKINLSPSNFKRKKGNVYQNVDNNNNINGNEQNLNQKNINGGFPIDNNNNNNNLINNAFREDGFPINNKNEENISLIKQNDRYNDNLFSNQSLKENTNLYNNNFNNNNKNEHNDNYNNNDYHNNKVNNNNNNNIKNKDDKSINYNDNFNNNFSNNINSNHQNDNLNSNNLSLNSINNVNNFKTNNNNNALDNKNNNPYSKIDLNETNSNNNDYNLNNNQNLYLNNLNSLPTNSTNLKIENNILNKIIENNNMNNNLNYNNKYNNQNNYNFNDNNGNNNQNYNYNNNQINIINNYSHNNNNSNFYQNNIYNYPRRNPNLTEAEFYHQNPSKISNEGTSSLFYPILYGILILSSLFISLCYIIKINTIFNSIKKDPVNGVLGIIQFINNLVIFLQNLFLFISYIKNIIPLSIFCFIIYIIYKIIKFNNLIKSIYNDIKNSLINEYNNRGISENEIIKKYSSKYNINEKDFIKYFLPVLRKLKRKDSNINLKEYYNENGFKDIFWIWVN